MRKVIRALVIGVSTATLFVAGTFTAAAQPSVQVVSGDYRVAGVHIRACPNVSSASCHSRGLGYPGQGARIDCFRQGTSVGGNDLWLHHRNVSTGVLGYSADYYMRHGTLNVPRC